MSATTPPGTLNITGAIIGVSMAVLLGFVLWALIFETVPDANQNVLLVVIGALTTNVTAIVSFFFGSSLGNRTKDTTIATMSTTAAAAQTALSGPMPDKVVTLGPGDTAAVTADSAKT